MAPQPTIVTLSENECRGFQAREGRYYFSRLAGAVVQQGGLAAPPAVKILTRGVELPPSAPCLVEGPFGNETIHRFRLALSLVEAHEVLFEVVADWPPVYSMRVAYPLFTVREVPNSENEYGEVEPFISSDPFENLSIVRFHIFDELPAGFKPFAVAKIDGARRLCAVERKGIILFGLPVFDILVSETHFPSLEKGYYERINTSETPLLRELAREMLARIAPRVSPAPAWPDGFRAAFTVRHDYDRLITDRSLAALLDFYDRYGVRCTWYTLVSRAPRHQLVQIASRGHEIALHSEARTGDAFNREIAALAALGFPPVGVTAHGGGGAFGFVGDLQYRWAEEAGLRYGEILGRRMFQPARVTHVRDGVPRSANFYVPDAHRSLDAQQDTPALTEDVNDRFSRGAHVTLMNHPDLRRDHLYTIIEGLDLSQVWRATHAEVVEWVAKTRFECAPQGPVGT